MDTSAFPLHGGFVLSAAFVPAAAAVYMAGNGLRTAVITFFTKEKKAAFPEDVLTRVSS